MTGLVYVSIAGRGDDLVVLDASRRLYAGLSRDASYWHVVHPAPVDLVNADGAVIRPEGALVCTCKGSAFRGTCYRVEEAEAFEAGRVAAATIPWQDVAPGEVMEAYGR